MRTPLGEAWEWRDYKAVNLHEQAFQDNDSLLTWVNQQPLAMPLTCLGDGHDGIGKIYAEMGASQQRGEILDWYHLIENMGKVGGSRQWLDRLKRCCGKGGSRRRLNSSMMGGRNELRS